jgi:hypothetical protein
MVNQSSTFTKEQTLFLQLIQNDIQFGIAIALYIYESLKLKQISKFIDRTDPTTLHHIKQMAESDIITIDDSKIVGKYYVLSELGRKIMNEIKLGGADQEDEKSIIPEPANSEDDLKVQANVIRTIGMFSKNLIYHSAHYAETVMVDRLNLTQDEKKKEGFSFRISLEDLKIKTLDQAEKLHKLHNEYWNGLEKLKAECDSSEANELDIDYLIFLQSIPVSVMHPEKIDKAVKSRKLAI